MYFQLFTIFYYTIYYKHYNIHYSADKSDGFLLLIFLLNFILYGIVWQHCVHTQSKSYTFIFVMLSFFTEYTTST